MKAPTVDTVLERLNAMATKKRKRKLTIVGAATVVVPELVTAGLSEAQAHALFTESLAVRAARRGWLVQAKPMMAEAVERGLS